MEEPRIIDSARKRAGNLLEIGYVESDEGPVIIHAMKARTRFLR